MIGYAFIDNEKWKLLGFWDIRFYMVFIVFRTICVWFFAFLINSSNRTFSTFLPKILQDSKNESIINLFFNKEDFKNNKPSINTLMITSGHAYEYNGGTKQS